MIKWMKYYLSFRNTNYTNPIVAFSEYAQANPYYKKYNDNGEVEKWLEHNDYFESPNPLWNASLNSRDEGKDLTLSNYFIAEYFPKHEWRFRARFGITYGNDDTEVFISPDDTRYDDVEIIRKGSYTATNTRLNQYEGEVSATFAKLFGKHQVNLVLGGNIYSSKSLTQGYSAQGFPEGDFTYPSFSNGYTENGSPTYYESVSRSVNAYFNAGYAFDDRYLMDFSLRSSGASVFGTSKQWNTTWSVGLGWNLHNENFLAESAAVNNLRLRFSYGTTGSQNFSPYQALTTYRYFTSETYEYWTGAYMIGLGNPDLTWQKTNQMNIGLEAMLFNGRVRVDVDWYNKLTESLLTDINLPISAGFESYKANVGEVRNRGVEVNANVFLIRDTQREITWSVGGSLIHNKNEILKISNSLEFLNEELIEESGSNPSFLYEEGESMNTIYVVRSLGIDPATGRELFLDREGQRTYDWEASDKVACGVNEPKVWGNLSTMFRWKGIIPI